MVRDRWKRNGWTGSRRPIYNTGTRTHDPAGEQGFTAGQGWAGLGQVGRQVTSSGWRFMKTAILASIGVSVLVGVVALLDMVMGLIGQTGMAPFAGQTTMDIMFVVAAGLIGWMGLESLQEQN